MYNFKYTLADLEAMMPWERSVYNGLLEQELNREKTNG